MRLSAAVGGDMLYVYDMAGRLVASRPMAGGQGSDGYQLDLRPLPLGTYVVIATDGDGGTHREQLIIQR